MSTEQVGGRKPLIDRFASRGECPACGSHLTKAVRARFQTLAEHVTNPNGISPEKQSYWCSDPECTTRRAGKVWLGTGEGPYIGWFGDESRYGDAP